ncbi:alpha/beta hydrolase [Nocardioides fonticola]|uniref:alpha/beta hydrolase n=1 Tax=Nocardioides fonticola TaxID=450363 RepID=UPI0031D05B42
MRAAIATLGPDLNPRMYRATLALLEPLASPPGPGEVRRDLAYGPDRHHRLNVFGARDDADPTPARPVLVFVHGGGFVGGSTTLGETPFYDNIGWWAVRSGLLGITMTYRLAPEAAWPAGSEDVARAIAWVRAEAASLGGDPDRIVLLGQSAGAVHVAGYLAGQAGEAPQVAGAVLSSCLYDVGTAVDNPLQRAYLGPDPTTWARASALEGLLATDVPLLLTVSEFDEPDFQRQALGLVAAWGARRGTYPPLERLAGHNHLSPVLSLGAEPGSGIDTLGPLVADFVAGLDAGREAALRTVGA